MVCNAVTSFQTHVDRADDLRADDEVDLGLAGEQAQHLAHVVALELAGALRRWGSRRWPRARPRRSAGGGGTAGAPGAAGAPGWPLSVTGGGAMGAGRVGISQRRGGGRNVGRRGPAGTPGLARSAQPAPPARPGRSVPAGLRSSGRKEGSSGAWANAVGATGPTPAPPAEQMRMEGCVGRVIGMMNCWLRDMMSDQPPKAGSEPAPDPISLCKTRIFRHDFLRPGHLCRRPISNP